MHQLSLNEIVKVYELPLFARAGFWGIIFIITLFLTPILLKFFDNNNYHVADTENQENANEPINTTEKKETNKPANYVHSSEDDKHIHYIKGFPTEKVQKSKPYKNDGEETTTFPKWTTGIYYNNSRKDD